MTRINSILATVAIIFLCTFCTEDPRTTRSAQKYEYHYEYVYYEVIVRRYDMANYVMLELVKDGKVIDKVKARISKQDRDHSIRFDLYFRKVYPNYPIVHIIPEYNTALSDSKARFRRYGIKAVLLKKRDGRFDFNYFGDKSRRIVECLRERLEDLSFPKENGYYYPIDLGCVGMDTLYNYDGVNPDAVKMRVMDENGSVLYSHGI